MLYYLCWSEKGAGGELSDAGGELSDGGGEGVDERLRKQVMEIAIARGGGGFVDSEEVFGES